ncbi:hypothetical protein [Saccharicrinis aurantiacus]|uniref:hypothetical protein n=1 Tax=Saccharicrinis aurantiacus TaxID=1849719 RepID=UPI000839461B|nr:hypothetical protein [Saccharicrinis aurantiacus]
MRYVSFVDYNNAYDDLMIVDRQLRYDFMNADIVTFDNGNIINVTKENFNSISYIFQENVIIRKQGIRIDYFKLDVLEKQIRYLTFREKKTHLVDRFHLHVTIMSKPILLSYAINYDPYFLMKQYE